MGKPISNDKREAIIKHKQAGESETNIAKWLFICTKTVQRIWKKYNETGSYKSRPLNNGRPPVVDKETMDKVVAKIQETPDMTLRELIDEFKLGISQAALCKRLIKLNLSFKKKTLHANGQKKKDVVVDREAWRNEQESMDISNIYWLDQMSVNCGMTRLYGRAFKHERVNEYVPDVRFERTSVMAAMGVKGMIAPLAYQGTLNGELFGVYVKKCLAAAMNSGDTLILDNLSVHKVKDVLKPLIDKGIKVIFIPAYSPDFNPIELAWSKIKAYLRKVKARSFDDLVAAIGAAIDTVSLNDISGWVQHCGYRPR